MHGPGQQDLAKVTPITDACQCNRIRGAVNTQSTDHQSGVAFTHDHGHSSTAVCHRGTQSNLWFDGSA